MSNRYCDVVGIDVPRIEVAAKSSDANTYALLIVALLEKGAPITLEEAARRFERAGVASADRALASLKRCRPGRPPIHRDGNTYALDPHDEEVGLWVFRLGLRPPKVPALRVVRAEEGALPSVDAPLTVSHLEEGWRDGIPNGWSAQRTAICVLDAHGGTMQPADAVAFVTARGLQSLLAETSATYWRTGAPVRVRDDGGWELDREHSAVGSARDALRERVKVARRWAHMRPDPVVMAVAQRRRQREREENAERLSRMRRVIVHAFSVDKPEAVVLIDVNRREISTLLDGDVGRARDRIADYDIVAGVDVRATLRALGFDPGTHRLAELGPPQKTVSLNRRGRSLTLTTALLVSGSCGISRPFGNREVLLRYFEQRQFARLRRRLEADAKSLFALYQYGRLHGAVRLQWGFLDEMFPVSWSYMDEDRLYSLTKKAHDMGAALEIVTGSAPGWQVPWARVRTVQVVQGAREWDLLLVDDQGSVIDEVEIQLARLVAR